MVAPSTLVVSGTDPLPKSTRSQNASKARSSGWIAFAYVRSRIADCDPPLATSFSGMSPPRVIGPICRAACV